VLASRRPTAGCPGASKEPAPRPAVRTSARQSRLLFPSPGRTPAMVDVQGRDAPGTQNLDHGPRRTPNCVHLNRLPRGRGGVDLGPEGIKKGRRGGLTH